MIGRSASNLARACCGIVALGVTSAALGGGPYQIDLEQVVADGFPGPGAGVIDVPGEIDVYQLTVDAETVVFFDELAGTCSMRWRAEHQSEGVIFDDFAMCSTDPGVHTLESGVIYFIDVYAVGDVTGPYSFVVRNVEPPQQFAIVLEEVVSDGVPMDGAGNLELPASIDLYTFDAAAGTTVFFDALAGSCNIRWMCTEPRGRVIFDSTVICVVDPGTLTLDAGGTYTIEVFGLGDATGTYSFTIWTVEPPDEFAILLEEVIGDGAPGPGAGNLEEPGAIDLYTFTAAAGQTVFFDELSGVCSLRWICTDENGVEVFSDVAMCSTDPGTFTLAGGTYTIEVYGLGDADGTYGFTIWTVEPPGEFAIALGDVVSEGVPGPGAGILHEPGATDFYTFEAPAGLTVFFDELAGACGLRWICTDENGAEVFNDAAMCSTDPGDIALVAGGTYTIEVYGLGDSMGPYSFSVGYVEPPQVFAIEVDEAVAPGVPGPGAGVLEAPGSVDVYTLFVPADDIVCIEEISGPCDLQWTCDGPDGERVFFDAVFCAGDPGTFLFAGDGTYTFTVFGLGDATGEYSFVVASGSLADFNGDCLVDVSDLIFLIAAWGTPDADVNDDGTTNVSDLIVLISNWS